MLTEDKIFANLNDAQREIVKSTEGQDLVIASAGSGKALVNSAIIKTPHGDVPIGQIQIGTEIFNTYGGTSKVIGVFPQGEKEIWEVEFSDGTIIECSKDHLWNYQTASMRTSTGKFKTATLEEISKLPLKRSGGNYERWNLYIPMTKAVSYSEKEFLISPYLLGTLIGDGGLTSSNLTFTNFEEDMINRVSQDLKSINSLLKKDANGHYRIRLIEHQKCSPLTEELKRMGLFGVHSYAKFIPTEYLQSSIDQRISLLQGLIDTDGECSVNNYYYSTTSIQLAKNIKILVESLGMTATIEERQTSFIYKGIKKPGRLSYRLSIKPSKEFPKLHTSLKHESHWKSGQSVAQRSIRRIIPTGKFAEMTCIKVDSQDELFLTDHFIVTHNSSTVIRRMAYLIFQGIPAYNILSVTFTKKAANELKERLNGFVGSAASDCLVGTFHAICCRILFSSGHYIGLENFTIIDDSEQKKIIKAVIKQIGTDADEKVALYLIGSAKNKLMTPDDCELDEEWKDNKRYIEIYRAYEDRKKENNYVDFDDLIMKTVDLLQSSDECRERYQNQFQYCFFDEVQDINGAQLELMRLFTGGAHNNMMAVG